ncbi:MAG: phosphoglucosamine mutase [Gleimia sp.]|jgi:phosphoglucosamine mutase
MPRMFGTDGVRGLANRDITPSLALELGEAAARYVARTCAEYGDTVKPKALIARDTRISGEFLDHALAAGLAAAGMDVTRVGVATTPMLAYLTATEDVALGAMISASHNPMQDNGIKFFAHGGFKLEDRAEDAIEKLMSEPWERPIGDSVGDIEFDDSRAEAAYIEHLVQACGTSLRGLRIAVDAANGAASKLGPEALREAGADVVVINASPDGVNINQDCGSTHPEQLQALTVASKSDFGVAFDGDADRCLAVDSEGNLIDGDKIMGALAVDFRRRGKLAKDTLVVTVMSNLGLLLAMEEQGINTVQTAVGDRYVLENMRENGYTLGGEQSGHVIASHHATTGDGVLTALLLARTLKETNRSLADATSFIKRLPQILVNVPGVDKRRTDDPVLQAAVAEAEQRLGNTGRVLLRPSGTEPLVRVMVEAATQDHADKEAYKIADVVKERLAL